MGTLISISVSTCPQGCTHDRKRMTRPRKQAAMNMVAAMKYSGLAQALVKATVKIARVNKRTLEEWQVSIARRRRLCDRVRCVNLPNEFVALSNPISPRSTHFLHTFLSVYLRVFPTILPIGVPSCQFETLCEMLTQILEIPGSKLYIDPLVHRLK